MCVVCRAAFLISFIVSEDSWGSARVSNEQIFSMTSSIYIELFQHPGKRGGIRSWAASGAHLDFKVLAEAEVVSYAVEAYTEHGLRRVCAGKKEIRLRTFYRANFVDVVTLVCGNFSDRKDGNRQEDLLGRYQ